jgi:hypothetical protein
MSFNPKERMMQVSTTIRLTGALLIPKEVAQATVRPPVDSRRCQEANVRTIRELQSTKRTLSDRRAASSGPARRVNLCATVLRHSTMSESACSAQRRTLDSSTHNRENSG